MMTVKSISWREYAIEFFMAYAVSLVTALALFRAPSVNFVHVVAAMIIGVLYFALKKYVVAFGNPAINVAYVATKKISLGLGAVLLVFQLAAASLAGYTIFGLVDKAADRLEGLATFAAPSFQAGLAEFVGGFILVVGISAYLSHAKSNLEDNNMVPLIFTVYGAMAVAALIGSLGFANPAVAMAGGLFKNYIYMLMPVIGGIVGSLAYQFFGQGKTFSQIYKGN